MVSNRGALQRVIPFAGIGAKLRPRSATEAQRRSSQLRARGRLCASSAAAFGSDETVCGTLRSSGWRRALCRRARRRTTSASAARRSAHMRALRYRPAPAFGRPRPDKVAPASPPRTARIKRRCSSSCWPKARPATELPARVSDLLEDAKQVERPIDARSFLDAGQMLTAAEEGLGMPAERRAMVSAFTQPANPWQGVYYQPAHPKADRGAVRLDQGDSRTRLE